MELPSRQRVRMGTIPDSGSSRGHGADMGTPVPPTAPWKEGDAAGGLPRTVGQEPVDSPGCARHRQHPREAAGAPGCCCCWFWQGRMCKEGLKRAGCRQRCCRCTLPMVQRAPGDGGGTIHLPRDGMDSGEFPPPIKKGPAGDTNPPDLTLGSSLPTGRRNKPPGRTFGWRSSPSSSSSPADMGDTS